MEYRLQAVDLVARQFRLKAELHARNAMLYSMLFLHSDRRATIGSSLAARHAG